MAFSNYPGGFANGLNVLGLPILNTYGNKVYWVDSVTGSDGNKGTFDRPFATIDYAIGRCAASKGDIVLVKPYHVETITAAITFDVIGVKVFGLSCGNQMPVITPNGAINAVTMTAAGCAIGNIEFAAPVTDAQTSDINIAAARCSVIGTRHIGSDTALNKADIIVLNTGANDALIDGARVYNTVVECVGGIKFAAAVARAEVRHCFFFDAIGFTNGAIYDAATATAAYIHHNIFANAKANTVVAEFGNNTTGTFAHNGIAGRHTTIASNISAGTGMNFFENYVVEEAAVSGTLLPAVDTE